MYYEQLTHSFQTQIWMPRSPQYERSSKNLKHTSSCNNISISPLIDIALLI